MVSFFVIVVEYVCFVHHHQQFLVIFNAKYVFAVLFAGTAYIMLFVYSV